MIDFKFGVKLGPIDRDHLQKLRQWRNDPRIYKWCRQSDVISDVEQDLWFDRQSKDLSIQMYSLIDKDDQLVGCAGLTSIDRVNQRAEFSLYVAPEKHGNGYGTEALKTLLSHGFRDLNLNLIWGECFDGNPAIKIFESLGMTKEGMRRQFYFKDGKYISAHIVSITRDEWFSK